MTRQKMCLLIYIFNYTVAYDLIWQGSRVLVTAVLTYLPLVPHVCICVLAQRWFRWWLVICSAPSHYLNQSWFIVYYWTLRNKLQWNLNQNTKLVIHENAFENVVCEMAAILSWGDELTPFSHDISDLAPGGRLNIRTWSCQYRDPHIKDKTVSRPSYL